VESRAPATPSISRRQCLAGLSAALLLPAGCATVGAGRVREYSLAAVPAELPLRGRAQPAVAAWTYGGGTPGPQLRARQGDRLRVQFHNQLPQATTVHWHGLRVPNAMDGVPHLTQAPIEPGGRFTYEFDVPDAGTYWYHSHLHSAEQLDRGLYGLVVVEERDPPVVDRDIAWVLDDWRLTRAGQVSETFGNTHDMAHAGRIGNVVTLNGAAPPADLALRAGERVRLRLLNAANARIFALEFTGHRPVVIALDGQPVPPHAPPRGQVTLAPGMRIDLLLDATGRPGERHVVHDIFYPRAAYELLHLQYAQEALRGQPLPAPAALAPNTLPEPDLGRARTHEVVFEGGMMGSLHRALLDGRPMDMRALLGRGKAWAVNGNVADGHTMPPALTLARGQSYVLAMRNRTRWHHPIHLHGHSFRVLHRNGRPTAHQEWQDTVLMAPEEDVDIAFVADNPGDWMFHCHILEHQEGGMMSVVRVA
jgi:FtsP/CotA-like multicopper oxidase with cupredoxin domain